MEETLDDLKRPIEGSVDIEGTILKVFYRYENIVHEEGNKVKNRNTESSATSQDHQSVGISFLRFKICYN